MEPSQNLEYDGFKENRSYRLCKMFEQCSYRALSNKFLEDVYEILGSSRYGDPEVTDIIRVGLKAQLNLIYALKSQYSGDTPIHLIFEELSELEKNLESEINHL